MLFCCSLHVCQGEHCAKVGSQLSTGVELKGLRDLNTPVLPSSLSARTMGCFLSPLPFPLPPTPPSSLPTAAKNLNRQEGSSYSSAAPVSVRPSSLFISSFTYRPSSHLLHSLQQIHPPPLLQNNPTAINQPSFSSGGQIGIGALLSFSSMSPPSSPYTLPSPFSPPVTSPLSSSQIPQAPSL